MYTFQTFEVGDAGGRRRILGFDTWSFAYDVFGFQWATVVESGVSLLSVMDHYNLKDNIKIILIIKVMALTVLVLGIYMLARRRQE